MSAILSGILGALPTTKEISAGEAHMLWENLTIQYDILELSLFFRNCAEDTEFKVLLTQDWKER